MHNYCSVLDHLRVIYTGWGFLKDLKRNTKEVTKNSIKYIINIYIIKILKNKVR